MTAKAQRWRPTHDLLRTTNSGVVNLANFPYRNNILSIGAVQQQFNDNSMNILLIQ
jgi:hypothetical protein